MNEVFLTLLQMPSLLEEEVTATWNHILESAEPEVAATYKKFLNDPNISQQLVQAWACSRFISQLCRINPECILSIIDSALALPYFQKLNGDIEMEYQNQTIGLYGVEHTGELSFNLIPKKTNCLAPDKCGIPPKTQTTTKKCGPSCC